MKTNCIKSRSTMRPKMMSTKQGRGEKHDGNDANLNGLKISCTAVCAAGMMCVQHEMEINVFIML